MLGYRGQVPLLPLSNRKNTSVEVLVLTYVGSAFKFWCLLTLLWRAGYSKPTNQQVEEKTSKTWFYNYQPLPKYRKMKILEMSENFEKI